MERKRMDLRQLTVMAMLSALAYISVWVMMPFPKIGGFLSFEIKDCLLAILGFLYGPLPALISVTVVALLEMVTFSNTGIIGMVMNVLSSAFFLCPAAYIYKKNRFMKGAVLGLLAGILCTTGAMVLWNWIVTPWYQKIPREVVAQLLLPLILPFNALKASLNAVLAALLYKSAVTALRKARLFPESDKQIDGRFRYLWIPCVLLLITLTLVALAWGGII